MTAPFSDRYWIEEFRVTQADLDRTAAHIRETGQAHDLTALARRLVRGRFRHGPETSTSAQLVWAEHPSVRLWDPAGEWSVGDNVIVRTWKYARQRNEAMVGEIMQVDSSSVLVHVEDSFQPERKFLRARQGSEKARKWRETVESAVAELRGSGDIEERVDAVILEHGERVISQLLDAMRADERFVRLAGRWFLRELAGPPTEEQMTALAWAMVSLEEPRPTADLVPLVQPPLVEGAPGLFGLYLAMRDHPDLFANADPGKRPRWVLAGPPPGTFTPCCAAYDPDTYGVLCLPGEPVPPEAVGRLWDLGLLKAVL